MARTDLNYFADYSGSGENRLTRAVLALVRLVPFAQVEFLRLVDPSIRATSLPSTLDVDFQTSRLHPEFEATVASLEPEGSPAIGPEVVSVYVTPDEIDRPIEVVESTRAAIYDGVLRYGNDLVIVVEAKVNEGVVARQAQDI